MDDCSRYWEQADYLPLDAIISYWCESEGLKSPKCLESKRYAICGAIERGEINYKRSDGKSFNDDALDLASMGLLRIEKNSFNAWVKQFVNAPQLDKTLSARERDTLLNIIGALVELIQTPRPGRDSDAAVINEMLSNYSDKPGIKERTLQEKFAAAKRSLLSK